MAIQRVDSQSNMKWLGLGLASTSTALSWRILHIKYIKYRFKLRHIAILPWCTEAILLVVKEAMSNPSPLAFDVPQGSVVGPLLFILFTAPLLDVIASHSVEVMAYADDIQLFVTFTPDQRESAVKKLELCIAEVRSWSKSNKLVMNDTKTELIHFSSRFKPANWTPSVKIGDSFIKPSPTCKNLGVVMDSALIMSNQVQNICKAGLQSIRRIGSIRKYLDSKSTETLVHAFVSSRLDCCNSLFLAYQRRTYIRFNECRTPPPVWSTKSQFVITLPLCWSNFTGFLLCKESSLRYSWLHIKLCTTFPKIHHWTHPSLCP